jgi:hypothetical protein
MPTTRFGAACTHGMAVANGKAAMAWPNWICGGDAVPIPLSNIWYLVFCILLLVLLFCIT